MVLELEGLGVDHGAPAPRAAARLAVHVVCVVRRAAADPRLGTADRRELAEEFGAWTAQVERLFRERCQAARALCRHLAVGAELLEALARAGEAQAALWKLGFDCSLDAAEAGLAAALDTALGAAYVQ